MSTNSPHARRPHHYILWLLALLAVYVLSSAPVQALYSSHRISGSIPKDLVTCYQPVAWLRAHTLLGEPLAAYTDWWNRTLKPAAK